MLLETVPPIRPSPAQPKSWVTVGPSAATTRLLNPSQPGSAEKSWRTSAIGSWRKKQASSEPQAVRIMITSLPDPAPAFRSCLKVRLLKPGEC